MKNNFLAITFALLFSSVAFAGPVSHFGALKVCGNNICGGTSTTSSTVVQLKGPSLFWSDGDGSSYYRKEVVDWFVDEMQIGVIRAAMGIRYYKQNSQGQNSGEINDAGGTHGYYFNAENQKNLMRRVIDAAILNDIYVIVDWHSHDAHNETSLATNFFRDMANEYKNVPNIIWEIYNEPVAASASQITSYSNTIRNAIRNTGNNNLILIGSNFYSQKPSEQASNYSNNNATKAESDNVAFTFHFYANSHAQSGEIGTSAAAARTAGYAVFGTEWGAVSSDGDGSMNSVASDTWTNWMDNNNISNCMWSASAALKENDKNNVQLSSMFNKGANTSALSISDLTGTSATNGSGRYFLNYMTGSGKKKWADYIPATHPKSKDVIVNVKCGESIVLNASTLGLSGDITKIDAIELGELSIANDKQSIIYKTEERGSTSSQIRFNYEVTRNNVTVRSKAIINITDRRPVVPAVNPFNVSRRSPRTLNVTDNLLVRNPTGDAIGIEFVPGSLSLSPDGIGSIALSNNNKDVIFTPDESQRDVAFKDVTLNYTVRSNGSVGNNSSSVVLRLQNMAPSISNRNLTRPNTEPITITVGNNFSGSDIDGDDVKFEIVYKHDQYPGTLVKGNDTTYIYTPALGQTGVVHLLAIVTDGEKLSGIGRLNLTLTGTGTPFGPFTPPTEIPEYETPIIAKPSGSGSFGVKPLGQGRVEINFAQSGHAKLDVYALSGKNMGTLLNGWQNAGSSEVSLKHLNLQKGVYILRLRQGSQIKTIRIVN